jgi:hypothetical protein
MSRLGGMPLQIRTSKPTGEAPRIPHVRGPNRPPQGYLVGLGYALFPLRGEEIKKGHGFDSPMAF